MSRPHLLSKSFVAFTGATVLLALSAAINQCAIAATGEVIGPATMSFNSLPGPHSAPYSGHTEGDLVLLPTAGSWFQSISFGNPGPSIFAGPIASPVISYLQLTDNAGLFTFNSFDFTSNNGDSTYDIQGYLGATLVYHDTGMLPASYSPFPFNTHLNPYLAVPVDALLIGIIPGNGVTSINLDNLRVITVPEPSSIVLLGLLSLGFMSRRRFARTAK
jgi:hypothetical protein